MKRNKLIIIINFILATPIFLLANNTIYQAGTITALTNGQYDSSITIKELKDKGSFGLGTVEGAKGEMMIYDGKAFLSDISGKAIPLNESITIPYASAFNFSNSNISSHYEDLTIPKILTLIKTKLYGTNYFYIFKITGVFSEIHARTIPPAKKGVTLSKWIAEKQKFHDLKMVKGTMIGIYSPAYLSNVTVPGFHFHFITADQSHVYHVYSFKAKKVEAKMEKVNNFEFMLPNTKEYQKNKIKLVSRETLSKMEESN